MTAANGYRATGLFLCDINIFRPHYFPLASGTQMLLLWTILLWCRLAISHHSVLLIFRSSLLVMFSDQQISAQYQSWTKSKSSWWNSKENNESTSKKVLRQLRKKISSRPLNPKPEVLRRLLFLVLQKDVREGFAGIQLRLTLHQIRKLNSLLLLTDDSTKDDKEQDADCVFCTGRFFEDHNGEEWIRCAKYCRRAHILSVVNTVCSYFVSSVIEVF
jgi:hypothetical protein